MTRPHLPSPVTLSYLAALRGIKPRLLGEVFTYADMTCTDLEQLICLAASNPEGRFFGIVASENMSRQGEKMLAERGVGNVKFKSTPLSDLAAALQRGSSDLPPLDYICASETDAPLNKNDKDALYLIAGKLFTPGGLFNLDYTAYDDAHGALKFLVQEFAPEMNAEQAKGFLIELKTLGGIYLSQHPDISAKLDQAIKSGIPDEFFMLWSDGEASAPAFQNLLAMGGQGLAYLGDKNMAQNYMELSLTPDAQQFMETCVGHPLYEPLKDYALARQIRSDVWIRPPAEANASMGELFGGFVYGIPTAKDKIPESITVPGAAISFATPLFQKLIDLLTLMPASVGDFLSHPTGKGYAPDEVVGALQILIACGIAKPMRGGNPSSNMKDIAKPKLVGSFNRFLDKMPVTGAKTWLASPVLGSGMALSPRDALVMQALDRVGLSDSVSALMPELERLSKDPATASQIMDTTEPTAEMAHSMIEDAVSASILKWYAYGLLEAA